MKKKLTVLGMTAILATSIISGTLAYYTSADQAHNVITSGGIGIEIIEKTKDANGAEVDFPEDGIHGVMPGVSISKIVTVKNTGPDEAWIRVAVKKSIAKSGSNAVIATGSDALPLELQVASSSNGDMRTVEVMHTFVDPDKWIEEDGYFYFKERVPAGDSTDVLFEEVHFAKEMGNEYQNCRANIIVSAQAVQTVNNPIPEGQDKDVTDILGWPDSEGGE